MSDIAIRVEHLGKQYQLGGQQVRYSTFRETLVQAGKTSLRWLKGERNAEQNKFWALDDVSFEVKHGEAVGIIGRNGAGKSTLLKILSQITSPTRGRVELYGRVGSLLEVGTGFHPELTGRENIFLNGAILGMSRQEIIRKFDEIVDFSGIEKFLDTAVKYYSSGMYVRLAFAVAAHLEPEILVVDEVLAVGDAEFQKKCLGKMGDVAHEGRTVLFVSHNMGAIRQLCQYGIYLEQGSIKKKAQIDSVIDSYMRIFINKNNLAASFELISDKPACIVKAGVTCPNKSPEEPFDINDEIEFVIEYFLQRKMIGLNLSLSIEREGVPLITSFDIDVDTQLFISRREGYYRACVRLPQHILKAGRYTTTIDLGHSTIGIVDKKNQVLTFDIGETSEDTTHKGYAAKRPGMIALSLPWKTERL